MMRPTRPEEMPRVERTRRCKWKANRWAGDSSRGPASCSWGSSPHSSFCSFYLLASGELFLRKTLSSIPRFGDRRRVVEISRRIEGVGLEAYILTPTIMGHRFSMNPVAVFLSVLFWGWIWGVAGALMAVPILTTVVIVCSSIERLAPVARFLQR